MTADLADAILLSGPGVCQKMSISVSKFHGMIRAGQMPLQPIRLGRSVRYRADELERWVASGCPSSSKWAAMRLTRGAA
jgi:predicted DNA-binding transcriptional regulator AlpA